jgi:cytidylate kinase
VGTVVFPQAEVKFFLSASALERGRRRYAELRAKGLAVELQQTIKEVEERDAADEAREHAPLQRAEDAILIDSTRMSIEEVLSQMLAIVAARQPELAE